MPTRNGHKDSARQTVEETKRLGAFMEEKAEQTVKAVGAGMESIGCAIHDHEPEQRTLHNIGEVIATKLESGGHYLETKGVKGVGEDLTNLIRRNPIPALLLGVGVGLLFARMLKR